MALPDDPISVRHCRGYSLARFGDRIYWFWEAGPTKQCKFDIFYSTLKLTYFDKQKLSTKLRPKLVSEWIRGKKKEVVPSLKSGKYRKRFIAWWKCSQLSWHKDSSEAHFRLFHDVPTSETWKGLRKGGTSGIYIVIMGLSWWVKA